MAKEDLDTLVDGGKHQETPGAGYGSYHGITTKAIQKAGNDEYGFGLKRASGDGRGGPLEEVLAQAGEPRRTMGNDRFIKIFGG